MRGSAVSTVVLAFVLGACAAAPGDASDRVVAPSVAAAPPIAAPPSPVATSPSVASPTFCPGRTWPPYALGGIPGVTALSRDRATVEIANGTDRTYYYRVAGWQLDQFETCRALGEVEVEEGPIAPGAKVQVMIVVFADRLDVPITVAFWDKPCGDGCQRAAPIAAMQVVRSPLEPAAS